PKSKRLVAEKRGLFTDPAGRARIQKEAFRQKPAWLLVPLDQVGHVPRFDQVGDLLRRRLRPDVAVVRLVPHEPEPQHHDRGCVEGFRAGRQHQGSAKKSTRPTGPPSRPTPPESARNTPFRPLRVPNAEAFSRSGGRPVEKTRSACSESGSTSTT